MPGANNQSDDTPRKSVARRSAARATGLRADGSPRRPSYTDATGRRGELTPRRPGSSATGGGRDAGGREGSGRDSGVREGRDSGVREGRDSGDARSNVTPGKATRGASSNSGAPRGVAAARNAAAARGETGRTATGRTATGRPSATGRTGSAGRTSDDGRSSARDTSSGRRTGATVGGSTGTRAPRPTAAEPVRKARPASASPTIRKPRTSPTAAPDGDIPGEAERLQKVLANAGIGSRRASEELIANGRVTVDGKVAQLGDRADPVNSVIYVDGERIITDDRKVYLAMNKPAGVVSTMADEKGRAALADFLGNMPQRVYHVGRLDQDSEGLLLLTNDGTLAHRLMHPSYEVSKTYLAEVSGPVRSGIRKQLMDGIELEDGPIAVDGFRIVDTLGGRVLVEVVLHEGRKHIVRRLLAEVGHPVTRLVRTAIGPIKLGDLKMGRTRRLTRGEIAALFSAVED